MYLAHHELESRFVNNADCRYYYYYDICMIGNSQHGND